MRRRTRANGKCPYTGKVRWRDHESAARVMNLIRAEAPPERVVPVRVYECPSCKGWHLTHEEG